MIVGGKAGLDNFELEGLHLFQSERMGDVVVVAERHFGETALFDGSYSMVIEMWDAAGNYAYSDAVTFDVIEGEIWTTVYED